MEFEHILIIDGYIDEPGCLGVPPYLAPLPRYLYGALNITYPDVNVDYMTIDAFRTTVKHRVIDEKRAKNQQKGRYDPNFSNPQTDEEDFDPNFIEGSSESSITIPLTPTPDQDAPSTDKVSKRLHLTDYSIETYEIVIFITGVSVPGKYLGGNPISFSELRTYSQFFPHAFKIICGPATEFGIGEQGGKPSRPVSKLRDFFDLVVYGDAELIIPELLEVSEEEIENLNAEIDPRLHRKRTSMDQIATMAIKGANLIMQHPNYNFLDGGNLVCEIETFRSCPRYKLGGCAFCTEHLKGPTMQREIQHIVQEVSALYSEGVRHFRIGGQTDFYAYQHQEYLNPKYPQPNPAAIEELLRSIRINCPDLKTLHIDNVNALNFSIYEPEAIEITQSLVKYCTPGNIAAIGVESVDPVVIKQNNLKATAEEIHKAVSIINQYGRGVGSNGNPSFLPGLNFIMGLPGETKETLELNFEFLKQILEEGLLLRRINLRKMMSIGGLEAKPTKAQRKNTHHMTKFQSTYFKWKDQVRTEIDQPLLQQVFPIGRVLTGVYAEKIDGGTLCRQPGTYPITCYVPKILDLHKYYRLIVVDHGFRSITCLTYPVDFRSITRKELESIPGIGKKRATTIVMERPQSKEHWLKILPPEVYDKILLLKSGSI